VTSHFHRHAVAFLPSVDGRAAGAESVEEHSYDGVEGTTYQENLVMLL
jgi:hypothetical protein